MRSVSSVCCGIMVGWWLAIWLRYQWCVSSVWKGMSYRSVNNLWWDTLGDCLSSCRHSSCSLRTGLSIFTGKLYDCHVWLCINWPGTNKIILIWNADAEMLHEYLKDEVCSWVVFWGGKTGWDQSNWSFVSLQISEIMRDQRPDHGCSLWWSWEFPVLGGLGPVQSWSCSSLGTGLPSTRENDIQCFFSVTTSV